MGQDSAIGPGDAAAGDLGDRTRSAASPEPDGRRHRDPRLLREAERHLAGGAAGEVALVVERLRRDVHVLGVRRAARELQRRRDEPLGEDRLVVRIEPLECRVERARGPCPEASSASPSRRLPGFSVSVHVVPLHVPPAAAHDASQPALSRRRGRAAARRCCCFHRGSGRSTPPPLPPSRRHPRCCLRRPRHLRRHRCRKTGPLHGSARGGQARGKERPAASVVRACVHGGNPSRRYRTLHCPEPTPTRRLSQHVMRKRHGLAPNARTQAALRKRRTARRTSDKLRAILRRRERIRTKDFPGAAADGVVLRVGGNSALLRRTDPTCE